MSSFAPKTAVSPKLSQDVYLRQRVMTAPPGQLVADLYDLALLGCAQQDEARTSRVLVELIDALDFQYKDLSLGLFRLYEYCLRQVKAGKFDEVSTILRGLKEVWAQAVQKVGGT